MVQEKEPEVTTVEDDDVVEPPPDGDERETGSAGPGDE
jgi:hypothetical protein